MIHISPFCWFDQFVNSCQLKHFSENQSHYVFFLPSIKCTSSCFFLRVSFIKKSTQLIFEKPIRTPCVLTQQNMRKWQPRTTIHYPVGTQCTLCIQTVGKIIVKHFSVYISNSYSNFKFTPDVGNQTNPHNTIKTRLVHKWSWTNLFIHNNICCFPHVKQ